jgi:hypothetical protein
MDSIRNFMVGVFLVLFIGGTAYISIFHNPLDLLPNWFRVFFLRK